MVHTQRTDDVHTLVLCARDEYSRSGLRAAAVRRGLRVVEPGSTPAEVAAAAGPGVAFRAPGGLLAQTMALGVPLRLSGPTPDWFIGLSADITGRTWRLGTPATAREMLTSGPVFVKLADAKSQLVPARRYREVPAFDAVMATAGDPPFQMLATRGWLDIDSEYRFSLAAGRC